jgi:hypothetical protein
MGWVVHVARIGATRNQQKKPVLVVTPKGKKALERRSCKCENDIKMALKLTQGHRFDLSGLTYKCP